MKMTLILVSCHFVVGDCLVKLISNFRLFVYPISPEIISYNLAASLALFEPVLTQGVASTFADINRDFLNAFVGIDMKPRHIQVGPRHTPHFCLGSLPLLLTSCSIFGFATECGCS